MATIIGHAAPKEKASGIREVPIGDSTFLQHLKYDPASFQLTVTMKSGAQYVHWYVYPATFDNFLESPSKGKFYASEIKGKNPSSKMIDKNVGKPYKKPSFQR